MTTRQRGAGDDGQDRPMGLLPPRLVPLSPEQEARAVDALANLLAPILAAQSALSGEGGEHADDDGPRAA